VLLLLFLFSDGGPDDAPTWVRLGSHLYAARPLFQTGKPVGFFTAARERVPKTGHLAEAAATEAGDVWSPAAQGAGQALKASTALTVSRRWPLPNMTRPTSL